jgi:hypothetical protein
MWLSGGIAAVEASHGRPASIEERTRGSQKVIVATARTVNASWRTNVHGDRLIVSRVVLDVEESLKGESAASMAMEVEGGTIDGITLRVSGVPAVHAGERGVFFLEESGPATYRPHLGSDGVVILGGDDLADGLGWRLQDLRRAVRAVGR